MVTSFCTLVMFRAGGFVMSVHEVRSELCCRTEFIEGTIHETLKLPSDAAFKFNDENEADCDVQMVADDATSRLPSAEQATEYNGRLGALFEAHVVPELLDV